MPASIRRTIYVPSVYDPPPSSEVTPLLTASRTSGPAPLAVHFHGIGTTAVGVSDPFRELGYYFDFDDSGSGTWAHSGQSKNIERGGPVAAHVFESPGTYEVLMSARRADGEWAQTGVTITVQNPDTVYSGTDTVCISTNTDTTGAPTGAQLLTNQTSWPTWQSNKRYLLRAGQNFRSFGAINIPRGVSNIQIGSFGSGGRPLVGNLEVANTNPYSGSGSYPEAVTFYDLRSNGLLYGTGPYRHVSWIRCSLQGQVSEVASALGWYYDNYASQGGTIGTRNALYWPEYITYWECDQNDDAVDTAIYGAANGWAIMGCTLTNTEEHNVRAYNMSLGIIAHNRIYGAGSAQHNIKLHGEGADTSDIGKFIYEQRSMASRRNVIHKNVIGTTGQTNPWSVSVEPQNELVSEGLEDIVIEDNDFQFNYSNEIVILGRRITSRGNTSVGSLDEYIDTGRISGLPDESWNGPHYTGGSTITTQAPTR